MILDSILKRTNKQDSELQREFYVCNGTDFFDDSTRDELLLDVDISPGFTLAPYLTDGGIDHNLHSFRLQFGIPTVSLCSMLQSRL